MTHGICTPLLLDQAWLVLRGTSALMQWFSQTTLDSGTSDDAESYYSRLKAIVRHHKPNIYTFLTHLNNVIIETTKDNERVVAGLDITRQKKEKFVRNIERRQKLKEQLQNGTYTLTQYISAVAYTFDSSVSAFQLPGESGDERGNEHQGPHNNAAGTQDVPPQLRCSSCSSAHMILKVPE